MRLLSDRGSISPTARGRSLTWCFVQQCSLAWLRDAELSEFPVASRPLQAAEPMATVQQQFLLTKMRCFKVSFRWEHLTILRVILLMDIPAEHQ